ncbi:aspartate/glutamate racemase family protein [Conexibacter woesei]|uniref:Aspartate racemase n=1 Tax=Conexibacter woesei (strain DSM 14684 / CCUG 47730 / CIP 108061 / JCM 11494 / NBRC 100937 / ID131577) TaxID=469383 RepID=D3F6Z0_CONWI|nr:amino acid racemase [Conexibacter woesei]ADB52788.1 aspartate racemase [Conexibacter woesei DSM 14684]
MRTIGIVGGFSWHSTAAYYRRINERTAERLGGHASAHLVLRSLDFAEVLTEDAREAERLIVAAARDVERAGAAFALLAANTAHRWASPVERALTIPLLHIADTTAVAVARAGLSRVGLLGTRGTMEGDFVGGRLRERHELDVLVPDASERAELHDLILGELTLRAPSPAAAAFLAAAVERLVARGAEGVVLGCTELTLVPLDAAAPTFDSAAIHADAAVELALSGLRS